MQFNPLRTTRGSNGDAHRALLCATVVVLALGGCAAGPMGTVSTRSAASGNQADMVMTPYLTAFDGSYRNTLRVAGSFGAGAIVSGWCQSPGQPVITVANGHFTYTVTHPNVPGDQSPVFPATFRDNGVFYGEVVAGTLTGSVSGTHIEGKIDGSACIYTFSGERI